MTDDLERLEAALAQKRRELEELEQAIRLVKQLRGGTPPKEPASLEFADASGRDAARALLAEAGPAGMHYRDLADAAVARGYRSDNPSQKAIRDSFGRLLRKNGAEFEAIEPGRYRLKAKRKK